MQFQPVAFEIIPVKMPVKVSNSIPRDYQVMVKVTHPRGPEYIQEVKMDIMDANQQVVATLNLYDDGAALNPGDGDVFARDSIFSNKLNPQKQNLTAGNYLYRFLAIDRQDKQIRSDDFALEVVNNKPPRILNIQVPDTLPSGADRTPFSVTVEDAEGNGTITSVLMFLFPVASNTLLQTDTLHRSGSADNIFELEVDSTFSAEKIGVYRLRFQAKDEVGDTSAAREAFIYLENLSPRILTPQLPDSFQLPSSDTLHLSIKIKVTDPQGLQDLDSVYFQTRKPDGNLGGGGAKILLFDDGERAVHGDQVANDGIFSIIISISSDNQPGDYEFIFNARDRVGNRATTVTDTITIYP